MNEDNEFGERRKRKTDMAFLGTGMACAYVETTIISSGQPEVVCIDENGELLRICIGRFDGHFIFLLFCFSFLFMTASPESTRGPLIDIYTGTYILHMVRYRNRYRYSTLPESILDALVW
jgi:hypothetical protein